MTLSPVTVAPDAISPSDHRRAHPARCRFFCVWPVDAENFRERQVSAARDTVPKWVSMVVVNALHPDHANMGPIDHRDRQAGETVLSINGADQARDCHCE